MAEFFIQRARYILPLVTTLTVLLLGSFVPGCGRGEDQGTNLKVVSTVAPITSIVENIGGDRIELEGVVPEGVNSHIFEPQPSLARLLADADLIIANGLFLEEPTLRTGRGQQERRHPHTAAGRQLHQLASNGSSTSVFLSLPVIRIHIYGRNQTSG